MDNEKLKKIMGTLGIPSSKADSMVSQLEEIKELDKKHTELSKEIEEKKDILKEVFRKIEGEHKLVNADMEYLEKLMNFGRY